MTERAVIETESGGRTGVVMEKGCGRMVIDDYHMDYLQEKMQLSPVSCTINILPNSYKRSR